MSSVGFCVQNQWDVAKNNNERTLGGPHRQPSFFVSQHNYQGYKPVNYTHPSVLAMPHYADKDLLQYQRNERPILNFNSYDKDVKCDRRSYTGHYNVMDGIPL